MKMTLHEKIAKIKSAKIAKEAQMRVAAAWTISKTLLPNAPVAAQTKLAEAMLGAPTRVLTASVRQLAINAHYTKLAETLKQVHKVELNDLLDDPSVLTKARAEMEKELKGEAKNASIAKKADDPAPPPDDAPVDTEDVPEGGDDAPPMDDDGSDGMPPPPPPPMGGGMGGDEEGEGGAEKVQLETKIEETESAIQKLEQELGMSEDQELNLDELFNDEGMDDKASALANEDEDFPEEGNEGEGDNDYFKPEGPAAMEAGLEDDNEITDSEDFFRREAADDSGIDGFLKDASGEDIGGDVKVDVAQGKGGDYFQQDGAGDNYDPEEDHDGDLLYEAMSGLKQPEFDTKRDTAPKMETPSTKIATRAEQVAKKAAEMAKKPLRQVKVSAITPSAGDDALSKLVFLDEDEF